MRLRAMTGPPGSSPGTSTPPSNATHGSTRGRAQATGLSQTAIARTWRAFGLPPHRADTFTLPTDPYVVEKVWDVVGRYLSPPDKAVVLGADEKSETPDRTPPVRPRTPGQVEQGTHDDVRHGTTSRFAARDVATGKVLGRCRRRYQAFVRFLDEIDDAVSEEDGVTVHRVMDSDATHKTPALKRWRAEHPRLLVHVAPTSASWLNPVERFFAEITEKRTRRGVFKTVKALEQAIERYLA
ncbi:MAG TPA: IS630 family transposase, partial [Urbifossiella sp.]|nr:IS630 family transposase [Urbifossiella sp.]